MSEELKPCPFCGGQAKIVSLTAYTHSRDRIYAVYIECIECDARTKDFLDLEREDGAHKQARNAWNWRV